MADPTTTETGAVSAPAAAVPAAAVPAPPAVAAVREKPAKTIDAGKQANRRIGVRLVIYTVATHAFAGFILLLFELGNRNK
ncbi:DUF6126 family protein [Kitasatospora sp. NPDC089913]|uniref:DUF6126 family protein n=1 Tax=Streptomycetaceae TaxID=2062 RepID=UPI00087BF948|nr:DUF6126 family protein [Streptomyces sp. TLI_053]SDT72322.1 hypothetical protein SAMN05216371_4278 [Streptomyces sp. TLI_053]